MQNGGFYLQMVFDSIILDNSQIDLILNYFLSYLKHLKTRPSIIPLKPSRKVSPILMDLSVPFRFTKT